MGGTPETLALEGARVGSATRRRDAVEGWIFVLPLVALLLGFVFYPFFGAIWLSLNQKVIGAPAHWVGIRNYVELLHDPVFLRVLRNTVTYVVGAVSLKLIFGMLMALVLNQQFRLRNLFRGVYLLPWVVPTAVSALAWTWMFNDVYGIINTLLIRAGLIDWGLSWLGDYRLAMVAIIAVDVWRGMPFFGVTLLAGLQTVPTELYEAARIDGASPWVQFWRVTLPQIRHVALITTILSAVWTFGEFQIIYILTRGGPGNATHVFSTYTYEVAFSSANLSKGVAVSLFVLPFLAGAIYLLVRHMERSELA
ncbi:MAG: sugar ABC transporter permease [Bacillota bacterium]